MPSGRSGEGRGAAVPFGEVSVLLPTRNEAGNIGPLVGRIRFLLPGAEILVLDDRSDDGTVAEARAAGGGDSRVRVIERSPPHGLALSLAEGIRRSDGRVVCWMDADGAMPPDRIVDLLRAVRKGADVAVASRYIPGGSDAGHTATSRMFSRWLCRIGYLLLGRPARDLTSGFLAVRREVLDRIPLRGDYGEYCIDLLTRARRLGYRIREIPYRCLPRGAGESKTSGSVRTYARHGIRYFACIARLVGEGTGRGSVAS